MTLAGFAAVLAAQHTPWSPPGASVSTPTNAPTWSPAASSAVVRNPIFTVTIIAVVGLTAMVPTWPQLLGLASLITGIHIQVRMVEEPDLTRTHGTPYTTYTQHVGRFLPRAAHQRPHANT